MKYCLVLVLVLAGCAINWGPQLQNGEEFKLGGTLVCCDCSLVHNLTYRIEGNDTYIKMWRNEWLTAERRKYLQGNKTPVQADDLP